MNTLFGVSLFQDLSDYRRDLDQVFGRVSSRGPFDEGPPSATSAGSLPAIESYRQKRQDVPLCHFLASIPESSLRSRGETGTIGGERKAKRSEKDVDFHYQEISYGSFEGIFTLPEGMDTDKLKTDYRDVPELAAPLAAAGLLRRIPANIAPMSKRIAA